MLKHFFIINILIIIGLIALGYLGYNKYINKNIIEILKFNNNEIENSIKSEIENKEKEPEKESGEVVSEPRSPRDSDSLKKSSTKEKEETSVQPVQPAEPTTQNGLYENNTYNYKIICPSDWSLKVRNEADVSIGVIPPKNGIGSVAIVVNQEGGNEIEEAKAEAAKYSGLISISEEAISLAGVSGTKAIINNTVTKTKRVYILLEKYGLYYALKYTEESAEFIKQAEAAVKTFQFTK